MSFILSAFGDEISEDLNMQMDVLEKHGIGYIEMRGVNGRGLVEHSLAEVKKIRERLVERGFKASAIGSPIGKISITDPFEPHLELFKHTLEIAQLLETKYIRMFSFFIPKGEDPSVYRSRVMDRWSRFIQTAGGMGVVLLHENEKDIYGDIPERCLDLVKTMNSSILKLTFDPANFIQCDVAAYPDAFETLKEHIGYVHIKDALFKDHSVVPSGHGDGRVDEILRSLYAQGYEGFLSIEPHLGSFAGFASLEPGGKTQQLPESGPEKFALAVCSLKKLLDGIAPDMHCES